MNHILKEKNFLESEVFQTLISAPLGFVDVGGRGGVHSIVEPVAAQTAILGFEPDLEEWEKLKKMEANSDWRAVEWEAVALGQKHGKAELHLLSAATNHSLLAPNKAFTERYGMKKWDLVGKTEVELVTLDSILFGSRKKETHWGEFLKIDTQGTEYEVLEGSTQTLNERTVAVLCEVEFCQAYANQKLFSDVEVLLRGQGFSFYGFSSMHYRSCRQLDKKIEHGRERAFYADAIFFKDPFGGGPLKRPLSKRESHMLFVCSLLTSYYDFALELAANTWAKGKELDRVRTLVKTLSARSPEQSYRDAIELADRVRAQPALANVEVGRFIDKNRQFPDYDDISLNK